MLYFMNLWFEWIYLMVLFYIVLVGVVDICRFYWIGLFNVCYLYD